MYQHQHCDLHVHSSQRWGAIFSTSAPACKCMTGSKQNTPWDCQWIAIHLANSNSGKHTKENYCNIHTPKTSLFWCQSPILDFKSCNMLWFSALFFLFYTWLATCLSSTTSVISGSPRVFFFVLNNLNIWDICALYVKSRSSCCVCLMRCIVLEHAG